MNHFLFSYGTLQLEKVQYEIFGRRLTGLPDKLSGFNLGQIGISDDAEGYSQDLHFYPIALPSVNPFHNIDGIVYEVTNADLKHADVYEGKSYHRMKLKLESGIEAWVYVASGLTL